MSIEQKIEEVADILASIGMPRAQLNDRSALCLLALLDLKPESDWISSANP
jgi:adenine-specific DNA-methyltransferase